MQCTVKNKNIGGLHWKLGTLKLVGEKFTNLKKHQTEVKLMRKTAEVIWSSNGDQWEFSIPLQACLTVKKNTGRPQRSVTLGH